MVNSRTSKEHQATQETSREEPNHQVVEDLHPNQDPIQDPFPTKEVGVAKLHQETKQEDSRVTVLLEVGKFKKVIEE